MFYKNSNNGRWLWAMICIHKLYKVAVKYCKLFSAIILHYTKHCALYTHLAWALYRTQIVQICTADCVKFPIPFSFNSCYGVPLAEIHRVLPHILHLYICIYNNAITWPCFTKNVLIYTWGVVIMCSPLLVQYIVLFTALFVICGASFAAALHAAPRYTHLAYWANPHITHSCKPNEHEIMQPINFRSVYHAKTIICTLCIYIYRWW